MASVMALGQTSVSLYFLGVRTSTGERRDGTLQPVIAYNSAGLTIAYTRERAATVAAVAGSGTPPVTLAADTTAWTSLGIRHVGAGLYRVDFPDAAFVTTGTPRFVECDVYGPTDTTFIFISGHIDLTGIDTRSSAPSSVDVAKINGQTVNAAAAVTFPSSIAGVGAAMTLTSGERTSIAAAVESALLNEADGSAVQQAIVDKINATDTNLAGLTLSAIAQAVRDVAISGAAANSFGALVSSIYARLGAPAGASMSADIALLLVDLLLVKAKTDNLPATPANEATLSTIASYVDTEVIAIKTVTDRLNTMLELAGSNYRLTLASLGNVGPAVSAEAAVTPFPAEIQSINNTPLDGVGTSLNPWRPAT